jgi:hypothetical protein
MPPLRAAPGNEGALPVPWVFPGAPQVLTGQQLAMGGGKGRSSSLCYLLQGKRWFQADPGWQWDPKGRDAIS